MKLTEIWLLEVP